MPELFPVRVTRFAVPGRRDSVAFVDDLGMLEASAYVIGQPDGLVEVEALTAGGSLELLGEPGAGKTTALQTITGQLPGQDEGGHGPVIFVPMVEVTSTEVFRERVIDPVVAEISASGRVTLVLDGLEECPIPGAGKGKAGLLKQLLQAADASAMRLLVGCRSADYPPAVHEVLTAAFPGLARYELAPLRRRDVEELADSRGVPGRDFLKEVTRTGAGPLAALPLSLDLLLRRYAAAGGLNGTATDLYESALLTLAGEHDPDRDPAQAPASAAQVLAVAAKLSCYLLVCGRSGFWTGPPGQMQPGDLDTGSLSAGQERMAGGAFDVTRPLVTAALQSALFTSGGPHRRVPAHARFAAYLAARHLASRRLPAAQLRSLLTAPTENGTGIIPALRETAAWLIALQPADTTWAEDADLTALVAYGALIDAQTMRAAMVERILARPRAFTGLGWQRGWNLSHPGLGRQLAPVLASLADPGAPQPDSDQAYLALILARQAAPAGVITTVLQAAARSDLNYGLRAVAARTAATLDKAAAIPCLTRILTEVDKYPDHDPDDELRGIALSVLWPGDLAADVLAASLITPQRDNVLGAYYVFRRRVPGQLSDDDVLHLLNHALPTGSAHEAPGYPGGEGRMSRDDRELAEGLLDRAFACRDVGAVIGPAAALAARCLQDGGELPLPAALDDHDAAGALTDQARRLRRLLAACLLSDRDDNADAYQLIWHWQPSQATQEQDAAAVRRGQRPSHIPRTGLLGPADLRWALETATAAGPEKEKSWIVVLRSIWDQQDQDAQDAAWQVRDTPLWAAFSASFDQVVLGSETEALQRSIFDAIQPRLSGWPAAAAHAAELLGLYQRATSDASAFPGLVYALHVDPDNGRFAPTIDDDLANLPGAALLPPGREQNLRQAAWQYLQQGTPPGPGILDTPSQLPLQAQAGYLALGFLVRHPAPGGGAQLPADSVLASWAPSVLITGSGSSGQQDPDPRQALLSHLAGIPSAGMPALAERLINGYLATQTWPFLLESLDVAWNRELAAALTRCVGSAAASLTTLLRRGTTAGHQGQERREQQLSSLRRTLTILAQILTRRGHGPGMTAAEDLVSAATVPGANEAALQAGRAAALGLIAGDPRRWPSLAVQLDAAAFLRDVLRDLAHDPDALTSHLTDDELGELWELLNRYWPVPADGPALVSGAVGPDELARHWRDRIPGTLARRGTAGAVQVLRQLAAGHPDIASFEILTREAEQLRLDLDWSPVRVDDLTRLLEDSTKRLVRSSSDLADLVHAGILEATGSLIRTGQLLWNVRTANRNEFWRPKSEVAFGAWLADQLSVRLERAGVVINREVRVRETTTQHGQAVDIQADAPVIGGRQGQPARCRVELKGNWHDELETAMRTQLADDYLSPEGLRHGIYVTAWFDTELWNDPDARRAGARRRDQAETTAKLDSEAETLRRLGLDVRSVVVYVPRPVKSARAEKPAKDTARRRTASKPGPPPAAG